MLSFLRFLIFLKPLSVPPEETLLDVLIKITGDKAALHTQVFLGSVERKMLDGRSLPLSIMSPNYMEPE